MHSSDHIKENWADGGGGEHLPTPLGESLELHIVSTPPSIEGSSPYMGA